LSLPEVQQGSSGFAADKPGARGALTPVADPGPTPPTEFAAGKPRTTEPPLASPEPPRLQPHSSVPAPPLPPTGQLPARDVKVWPKAFADARTPPPGVPGIVLYEEEEPPVAVPPLAPVAAAPVAPAPAPAAAPVLVPLAAPGQSPHPVAPMQPVQPARLKQRIEAVCGQHAKAVQVLAQADKTWRVRITLSAAAPEKQLTEKILNLPEMMSPQVRLEIVLAP
jgi:hypothetical protein